MGRGAKALQRVPKKKAGKAVRRGRLLLLLLAVAAALGAGAYFLRPQAVVPALPEDAETVYLLHRPAEEIAAVAIAPREGAAYPLVRTGDGLRLLGQEDQPLRDWLAEDLLNVLPALIAEDIVADTTVHAAFGSNWSDFGLEPPAVTVTVTYLDGEKIQLSFGDVTPGEAPTRYCRRAGDPLVYTVMTEEAQVFFYEMAYWRAFDQPRLDASLLDRIDVSGDVTFGAYYTPSGWQMDAPLSYPLDTARTDALLQKISAMAFEALLGEESALDLSLYGLDPPALTAPLTQAPTLLIGQDEAGQTVSQPVPQKKYTLKLGAETGKSGVYLAWEGRVFKASNFLLRFWKELDAASLLLKSPVNLLVNDLSFVALACGDVSAAYEVRMVESLLPNNQIATDEYGNTLYDCAVRRAGEQEDMDAEQFLDWYVRLSSLSAAGELPAGFVPSGEPRAVITLQSPSLTRTVALFPYDALHDAISVDGVALYYVESAWLNRVLDAP